MEKRRAWVEVDLDALRQNARVIGRETGVGVMAVVKANGYGQGSLPIARALAGEVAGFGVANLEEAVELGDGGITEPVHILGPLCPGEMSEAARLGFRVTIHDRLAASRLSDLKLPAGCRVRAHLKIDTGMCRLGVRPSELPSTVAELARLDNLELEGVFSHFSSATTDREFSRLQLRRFRRCLAILRASGISGPGRAPTAHMAASAAITALPESYLDLVRPGRILFGVALDAAGEPPAWTSGIRPVLTLKARVASVREVPRGSRVGYGARFMARRKMTLAILPLGYCDGYNRALTNRGTVLWRDRPLPVAGEVCMDMTTVDATGFPVRAGDEVTLMAGNGAGDPVSPDRIARECGIGILELLIGLGNRRLPRFYGPG